MHTSQPEPTDDEYELALLGRAVRDVRQRRHMSSSELASRSGVARARIDALEAGRLDPTYDLLVAVAHGLDVQLAAFATRVEELKRDSGAREPE